MVLYGKGFVAVWELLYLQKAVGSEWRWGLPPHFANGVFAREIGV